MDEKKKEDLLRVLKWLGIGSAVGAGATYAVKKYHNNKIDKEVESIINRDGDDSNTLVLTIPREKIEEYKRQRAMKMKSASARDFVKHFPETDGVTVTRDTGNLSTVRNRLGAFVSDSFIADDDSIHNTHRNRQKSAGAFFDNSVNTATTIAAAVLGTAAGYKVVSEIMAKKQLAKLDAIAEAERHEYLDKIMKQSEFSGVKQAARPASTIYNLIRGEDNIFTNATGGLLALILAGSVGTAALTRHYLKKYQDKKDVSKILDSESEPEIKRVVIKSSSHDENPTSVSCDACLASICNIVDTMRHIGEKTAEEDVSRKLDPEYIKSMTIKFASDSTSTNSVLSSNSNLIKLASLLASLAEISANNTILSDNSNSEILDKLDEISKNKNKKPKSKSRSRSSKKNKTRIELEVDSMDPDVLAYVLKHKSKIMSSLDKLKYTGRI